MAVGLDHNPFEQLFGGAFDGGTGAASTGAFNVSIGSGSASQTAPTTTGAGATTPAALAAGGINWLLLGGVALAVWLLVRK